MPTPQILDSLVYFVDFRNITLNAADTTVFLLKKGMMLDLGGIAKGYVVDRASELLMKNGIKNFMINAGGDVYTSGHNSKNKKWVIGVKHPRTADELLAKFSVTDLSVSTSGDYERFEIIDGRRYHHILYPASGMPGNLCRSVTVLCPRSEEGTVLAKYIFLLGYEKSKELNISMDIKYIIVDSSGAIKYNKALLQENDLELLK